MLSIRSLLKTLFVVIGITAVHVAPVHALWSFEEPGKSAFTIRTMTSQKMIFCNSRNLTQTLYDYVIGGSWSQSMNFRRALIASRNCYVITSLTGTGGKSVLVSTPVPDDRTRLVHVELLKATVVFRNKYTQQPMKRIGYMLCWRIPGETMRRCI